MTTKGHDLENSFSLACKVKAIWKRNKLKVALLLFVFVAWTMVILGNQASVLEFPLSTSSSEWNIYLVEQEQILAERRTLQRKKFFREEIVPLIQETTRRNQKIADQAIMDVKHVFRGYQSKVDPFVEDLVSLKTRGRILWEMPGDWLNDENRVKELVSAKFEEHLFSEEKMIEDISHVLTKFAEQIRASENQLLMDCKASVAASDMPEITLPGIQMYASDVQKTLSDFAQKGAERSVYNGMATLVASEAGAIVAVRLVRSVLTGLGAKAAISASQTVGGAATGSVFGAKIGSVVPGKGTIIGASVGLAVGIVIDWWMTDRFKEKMTDDLKTYIHELQVGILQGTDGKEGLRHALRALIDDYSTSQTIAMRKNIVEMNS